MGPHSKVQFVVNYDAPANMEERCGNIGWQKLPVWTHFRHLSCQCTVYSNPSLWSSWDDLPPFIFFFEPNNSHFSRTMCTESAVRAAQVKKAWSLPMPTVQPWQSWQCRAGDAYTCLYESENSSLGECNTGGQ